MRNPFKLFTTDKTDRKKQRLEQVIKEKAWDITKKTVSHNLNVKDVDELEKLYKEYFKSYPDVAKEENCRIRIDKLRKIV